MTTSLAVLLASQTEDQCIASLLATLTAAGFPVTAWQSGGVARTLVKSDAKALADLHTAVAAVAAGAYLDLATGDWLTLHAVSRYDVTRTPATFEEWDLSVTVAATAGPYTVTPAALLAGTSGGVLFRSTAVVNTTLASGATTTVRVRAETSGAAGSAVAGTLTTLVSPALAGVTVTNPGTAAVAGVDAEADAPLRARCRARWATIGYGATAAAYQYWATTCPTATAVSRAKVVAGPGDGTLSIYLATASGPASGAEVAAVDLYIKDRCPLTDAPTAVAAGVYNLSVAGTIYVQTAYDSTANRNLVTGATGSLRVLEAATGIGGSIDLGAIYRACYAAAGVTDVDLTSPTGDISLGATQVVVVTITLAWVLV